ncbi:mas-related G-protein coupled receptor member A7-like [Macrotis lagotis]|uniref:mas-related G-protein coupled receptor member A7-like n=1 Tax=Macrotis lagotis TaxID=92651 RepID=UPI003D685838
MEVHLEKSLMSSYDFMSPGCLRRAGLPGAGKITMNGSDEFLLLNYVPVEEKEIFRIEMKELVEPEEFSLDYWMEIPSLLITLVGLVGNGLVLWLLGFCIKRNSFSVYILNLAAADSLYLCCSFLMSIHALVSYRSNSGLHIVLDLLKAMFYLVGMSLLAVISTERCLSVLFPIWHRCNRPKHTSTVVCIVLWALIGLVWLTFYILCVCRTIDNICAVNTVVLFVWFVLLFPWLGVSSLTLLLRVQCTSQYRQPPRLYLLVLLTVLVFLLCGMPLGISGFILRFHRVSILLWLPQLLACVNSSANPFIYFILGRQRHKRGREALRAVLQRALGDEQELRDGVSKTTHSITPETSF